MSKPNSLHCTKLCKVNRSQTPTICIIRFCTWRKQKAKIKNWDWIGGNEETQNPLMKNGEELTKAVMWCKYGLTSLLLSCNNPPWHLCLVLISAFQSGKLRTCWCFRKRMKEVKKKELETKSNSKFTPLSYNTIISNQLWIFLFIHTLIEFEPATRKPETVFNPEPAAIIAFQSRAPPCSLRRSHLRLDLTAAVALPPLPLFLPRVLSACVDLTSQFSRSNI